MFTIANPRNLSIAGTLNLALLGLLFPLVLLGVLMFHIVTFLGRIQG